ncbi:hypothetical protein BJY27_001979 [Streptomyces rapamycinicus]|uniref:Uncharacterized protein n=2 Tax=Streptomyces rapamycinicus TaxID=1226757 RepID=A0ABR6LFG1_9ACTN|nr:hypothetical protein [Streptomyces rapamycinicus]RLV74336.1 putative collagen alpha-1(VII) chain-like [Streptomyces rapamycinicus NRRL 5491]
MRHRQTTDSLELPASARLLLSRPWCTTARMAAMADAGATPTVGTGSREGAGGLGTERPARPRGAQDSALGTASVSAFTGDAACADPPDAIGTGALRWPDSLCGPAQSRTASSNPHNATAMRQRYPRVPGKRPGRTWRCNGNSSSAWATAPGAERGWAVGRDRQDRVQRPECPRTSVWTSGSGRSGAPRTGNTEPGRAYGGHTPTGRRYGVRLNPQNHAGSGVRQRTSRRSQPDRAGHPRWHGRRSRRPAEHRRARGHPYGTVLRLTHQTLMRRVRGVMVAVVGIVP